MVNQLCNSGQNETKEHMEKCDFTKEMLENLDMGKEEDKLVLWRKLTCALHKLYNKKDVNKDYIVKESENMQNPDRVSNVLPVPREETRQWGHEGITTLAVEANSARDMSVGTVICDHPP